MKVLSSILLLAITTATVFASAATPSPVEACFRFKGTDGRYYISKVHIISDSVSVIDYNASGDVIGALNGRALGMSINNGEIEIKDLTLSHRDSWVDHAHIKITPTTVTFDSPGDRKGPRKIIQCPAVKQRTGW